MAQFIKVGDKVINLDNISRVQDNPTKFYSDGGVMDPSNMVIRYLAVHTNDYTDYDRFDSEEADALRSYFNSVATDIVEIHRAKLENEKRKKDWVELLNTHAVFLCRPFWQIHEATKLMDDDMDMDDFKGEAGANRIEEYIKSYRPEWRNE